MLKILTVGLAMLLSLEYLLQ